MKGSLYAHQQAAHPSTQLGREESFVPASEKAQQNASRASHRRTTAVPRTIYFVHIIFRSK